MPSAGARKTGGKLAPAPREPATPTTVATNAGRGQTRRSARPATIISTGASTQSATSGLGSSQGGGGPPRRPGGPVSRSIGSPSGPQWKTAADQHIQPRTSATTESTRRERVAARIRTSYLRWCTEIRAAHPLLHRLTYVAPPPPP